MKKHLAVTLLSLLLVTAAQAERRGPTGQASKDIGPAGGVHAEGSRSITGNKAQSSFSMTGKEGKNVSGSAQSTVGGGRASGSATVQTSEGRAATAQGQGHLTATGATGSGSISTNSGKSVNATGNVDKTSNGISASGTATTGSGKNASGTIEGNKQGGTATVTTDNGTKSVGYGNQGKRGQ